MSRWTRYRIAVVTAPIFGAAIVMTVTLIARSGLVREPDGLLFDQIGVAVVLTLLSYVLLVLGVALIGLVAVAAGWRSIWANLGIGLGLGLIATGLALMGSRDDSLEDIVTVAGLPLTGLITSYSFWRIVFRKS